MFATQARDPPGRCQPRIPAADAGSARVRRHGVGSPGEPTEVITAPAGRGPDLDIAFLGTVALQQAGLPLDEIFATRASLLKQCGEAYFASPSERKRRFHRTLVNLGIIDVAPAARQQY